MKYYMKKKQSLFLKTAAVAIVLNVVLSQLLSTFATAEEKKMSHDTSKLSLKSQIMNMLVHHKHVMVSSSLVVGLVAGLSCWIACKM